MKKDLYDVAVIGGGPGGYSAALYCARSGYSVLVLEKLSAGGQMATTGQVDNYPGFDEGIDGFELGEKMQRGAQRFGVETEYAEVSSVDLEPEIKLRGRGVAYCAACDGQMYRNKTVVIAGGGNSAAADALFLSKICSKVYLVHRRDSLRASRIYMEPLEKSGVEFIWDSKIMEILHDKRVTGVRVENVKDGTTREIPADGVFVAVGRVPDTALFAGQLELDPQGYIIADESTRTNIDGVFAVGDVPTKALRQIVTAAADGATASHYVEEYLM